MENRITQNVIVSNANKSNVFDLSNDVLLSFPPKSFYAAPKFIELLHADLRVEINMFGNTNNTMMVIFDEEQYIIVLDYTNKRIKSNEDFSDCLEDALNNPRDPNDPNIFKAYSDIRLSFKVIPSSIEHVITNYNPERDATTTAFAIKSTLTCSLDFNHKDTIGSLIGFGGGLYENSTEFNGVSTQSITAYNYIEVMNISASITETFPNYGDVNCKMILFDSDKNMIPNNIIDFDATVSLNKDLPIQQYSTIGDVLKLIEDQLNEYVDYFTPPAEFEVTYNPEFNKVTINNKTGAKFGVGFNFADIDECGNSSGSLHYILGFKQKNYYNVSTITSDAIPLIFDYQFSDDYVLICSDLIKSALDIGVIGIGNADNIKKNDTMFAIPLSQISNFSPYNSYNYRVNIANSKFSQSYSDKVFSASNPNYVNIYLRLLSGRHITCVSQFIMSLSFIFQ